MANTFISLPNEILHNILKFVDPCDLGKVFRACKLLGKFVDDHILFKEVYCNILDEPVASFKPVNFEYKQEIIQFCEVRRALTSDNSVEEKRNDLIQVSRYLTKACYTAPPKNSRLTHLLKQWFNDEDRDHRTERNNIEAFLCQSRTFFRAHHRENNLSALSFTERQASAKLHVFYGVPIFLPRQRKWGPTYPYAVSVVYDLRNYSEESKWGPYLPDGDASVDWEKMEAVMLVLGHNMHAFTKQTHGMFPKVWKMGFEGVAPDSYFDDGRFEKLKREGKRVRAWEGASEDVRVPLPEGFVDPYNVTGTWTRVVCFLDFHDLFAYNFTTGQPEADQPRPALNTTEAIRLITMEIRATKSESPGPEDGQGLPVVYFEGVSKSSMNTSWDPNANSTIRGSVRLTKAGEVRWQTISVYAGEERWASEGIQVGGIRSGRGVLGHWFDKDHDVHGPAGPTAFWKISDGFREYYEDDEEHANGMYHPTTANVQYEDDDDDEFQDNNELREGEGEGDADDENVFHLGDVSAAELVTQLQLSGQTAAQLAGILTQLVGGGHLHHHLDDPEDDADEEDEEADGN